MPVMLLDHGTSLGRCSERHPSNACQRVRTALPAGSVDNPWAFLLQRNVSGGHLDGTSFVSVLTYNSSFVTGQEAIFPLPDAARPTDSPPVNFSLPTH